MKAIIMAVVLVVMMAMSGMAAADVQTGWPVGAPNTMDDPSYVTIDFENGMASYVPMNSPYDEITFESMGQPWSYGCRDVLNIWTYGVYVVNGYSGAWCGVHGNTGKITFDNDVSHVSILASINTGLVLEAYNDSNVVIASCNTSKNIYSYTFDRMSVDREDSDISYVIVHDSGNRWIFDDLIVGGLNVSAQMPYSYEGQVAANLDGIAYLKHGLGYDYDNGAYADMFNLTSDLTYWNPETEVFETGTGIGNAGLILRAYNYRNDDRRVKWSTPIQMMRHDFKVDVMDDDIGPGDVVFIDVNNNGTTGIMGMVVSPNMFGETVVMSLPGSGVKHYSMSDILDMDGVTEFRRLPDKIIGNHNPIHQME